MACYGRPFLSICLINSQVKHFLYPFFFSFFFSFFLFFLRIAYIKASLKGEGQLPPSNLPWESSSKLLELLSLPFFFPSLLLSIMFPLRTFPLRSLSSFVILFFLDVSLAPPQNCCYSIVGGFSSTESDWCASSSSWP